MLKGGDTFKGGRQLGPQRERDVCAKSWRRGRPCGRVVKFTSLLRGPRVRQGFEVQILGADMAPLIRPR